MIKAILLAATVPFMTQHRNVLPKTEISTNFYGSVTGIVDQAYIETHGGGGGGGSSNITTQDVQSISSTIITNKMIEGFVAAGKMPPWLTTSEGTAAGVIGKSIEYYENGKYYKWGVDYAAKAAYAKEAEAANGAYALNRAGGYGPYLWSLAFDGNVFEDRGGRLLATRRNPISSEVMSVLTNAWTSDLEGYVPTSRTVNNKPLTSNISLTYTDVNARSSTDQSFTNLHIDNGYNRYFLLGSQFASSYLPMFYLYDWDQIEKKSGTAGQSNESLPTYIGNRVTSIVPSWARNATKPSYTVSEITDAASKQYVTDANSNTVAIVQTWEGFLDGSNVVFSITNYVSGSYNLNTAKLRIMEMTNGVYREVYNSRDEIVMHIDNFRTNDFRVATNSVITSVDTKIAGKADKAWGKYTSTGTEIAGIGYSNTVYMTEPTTVFAGGMEYARFAVGEGSICVLTTKGAPVYTTGDEGTFKFQDNGGTNYFGFAKTDSYTIGANASGISVQNQIVTITYDVSMSGVPCIWYIGSLENYDPTAWEQLNTPDGQPIAGASHIVQWEQNPPEGKRICYINCPEPKGFFKATIEVAGDAKFVTNMPADLAGGILATNQTLNVMQKVEPYISNDQVLWRVKP